MAVQKSEWTPIVEGQTGQQVADNFEDSFNNVDTGLDELETQITNLSNSVVLHGINNPEQQLLDININPQKFNVTSFDYYIQGTLYSFAGGTFDAGFGQAGDYLDIGVDSSGLRIKINGFFTPSELKTVLEVGRIATVDGTNIAVVGDSAYFSNEFMENLYIRFKSFEGSKFFDDTCKTSENSTTPFTLDIQSGVISTANMQKQDIQGETQVAGFPVYTIAGDTDIRPQETPLVAQNTQYDDGTNLAPIPVGHYVVHTLFRSSGTGSYYLQYGMDTFDRLNKAVLSTPINTLFNQAGSEVEKIAKIIVQEGASEISVIYDIRNGRNIPLSPLPQQEDRLELSAESLAVTQEPDGTDNPMRIEFGVAQSNDNIDITSDGLITFKTSQNYRVDIIFHFGRDGGGGESELFGRTLVNGIQEDSSFHAKLADSNVVIPFTKSIKKYFEEGDVLSYELIRDSAGNNSGGLFQLTPQLAGWNSAPTAQVTITSFDF